MFFYFVLGNILCLISFFYKKQDSQDFYVEFYNFETVNFLDVNSRLRRETKIFLSRLASETLDVK